MLFVRQCICISKKVCVSTTGGVIKCLERGPVYTNVIVIDDCDVSTIIIHDISDGTMSAKDYLENT